MSQTPGRLTLQLTVLVFILFRATFVGAENYQVLYHFRYFPEDAISSPDGGQPTAPLMSDGSRLYGTAPGGGNEAINAAGVVYSLNFDGSDFQTLHTFRGDPDGSTPTYGGLINVGTRMYGTTSDYPGTVYSLDHDGSDFQIMHQLPTGSNTGLVQVGSRLYGTTSGGSMDDPTGTVFGMDFDGSNYQTLHEFAGTSNRSPQGNLIQVDTTLYGTTYYNETGGWEGTVFSINTDGSNFQTLHAFDGSVDEGGAPFAGLLLVGSKLYGTTSAANGTVYSLNLDGSDFQSVHSFDGPEGLGPEGALIQVGSRLYGTAFGGGATGGGTVFSMNLDGSDAQALHSFTGIDGDGLNPLAGLLQVGSTLYGTTYAVGGINGYNDGFLGTVFAITIPEPSAWILAALAVAGLVSRGLWARFRLKMAGRV